MKNLLTTLLLLIPFVVLGQRKTDSIQVRPQWSINDKIQYNPFSATNIIDTNHKIWVKIPQDDTIIRIHHMGRFIILSQSIKNGSFEQIAARDTNGTWVFNKNSSIAMNALYFWITHIHN